MSQIPGAGGAGLQNPANPGGAPHGALGGGQLSFGSVPAFGVSGYGQAYQNALSLNQQNYANILSGYGQLENQQSAAQQGIQQGYGNLYGTVLSGIQGIGASQAQAIRDAYAQQSGGSAQQLINAGLGNTTVQQSVQRGNLLDRMKAETGLANQLAQLQAGYQSQLGMAGLGYANQANMQNTALKGQQLNWMNSVNAPYPNAAAYGQLAQQQGYAQLAGQLYGQIPKGIYGGRAGLGASVNMPGGGFGVGGAGGFGGGGGGAPMLQSQAGWIPPTGKPGGQGPVSTTPYGYDEFGNPIGENPVVPGYGQGPMEGQPGFAPTPGTNPALESLITQAQQGQRPATPLPVSTPASVAGDGYDLSNPNANWDYYTGQPTTPQGDTSSNANSPFNPANWGGDTIGSVSSGGGYGYA